MPNIPPSNPNVPQVPNPVPDATSLTHVTQVLKQAVDSLAGHRGTPLDRAVTFRDIVDLGLATELTITSDGGQVDYADGSETAAALEAEIAARIAADLVLQANIDAEEAARIAADAVLQAQIDIINERRFWEFLDNSAGTDIGHISDQVFLPNVDMGLVSAASITSVDLGTVF